MQRSAASSAPAVAPNKWTVFAIVAVGVFMATLDSSIVNISLPAIGRSFGTALSGSVEWVIIAYLVMVAATLLIIGRVADLIGRKPIWASGLVVFTLASALCGFAPSLLLLVITRGVQGLGGSLIMAISPALLTTAFSPKERGRALGLNAPIVALGTSAGPTLGGIITEHLTWRWIFFINVPLGILGVITTLRVLPRGPHRAQLRLQLFDIPGAILLALGLGSLTLGLSFGQEWGWTSARVIGTLTLAVLSLAALLWRESHLASPILALSLLQNRVFASAVVSQILSFLALFAVSFLMPFYLEQLRGFSTQDAGLLLTPLPLALAAVSPFSGLLADRFGTRWLAAGGLTIACLGLASLATLGPHSSISAIIWRLALTGAGQALFQSPNNSAMLGAAPTEKRGAASGFLATGRVVGQSVSVALGGAVFATLGGAAAGHTLLMVRTGLLTSSPAAVTAAQHTFTIAFHGALVVSAALAAVGILTSLTRGQGQ